MINICHRVDLNLSDELNLSNVHSHLLIDDSLELIPLKLYLGDDFDAKSESIIGWIQGQPDYTEFAKKIAVSSIREPNNIIEIDFSNSPIGNVINRLSDPGGTFFGVSFKDVTIRLVNEATEHNGNYTSVVHLDNHAFDLFNTFIPVQAFTSNKRIWQSENPQAPIQYAGFQIHLDLIDKIENDADSYPQVIKRLPVIIVDHPETSESSFMSLVKVFCAALSFYQGHEILYNKVTLSSQDKQSKIFKKGKKKEKILNKNLGRFGIQTKLHEFLSEISPSLIGKSQFVHELISIFNQSIQSFGTTQFMLLFTVVEKLRDHVTDHMDETKFTFSTNRKETNKFIRSKLIEIKALVVEGEQELFESTINDKVNQIKFKPQKDQFLELFQILEISPEDFELDWGGIVRKRGDIFHGEYINTDNKAMKELNSKFSTFVGNIVYQFLAN